MFSCSNSTRCLILSSFRETKEWILRSPFPFCLPFLNLPVLFDWAGWRQYWHCNTLFLFQIFLHSHNSQWQPGGGREGGTSDSVCPSSPGPDIYHRLKLSFLPCLIPLIYDTSQCSNCLFWRGWGWAESLLDWKAKYWDCRKKQDPTSLVWARAGRRKRWQRVRGGKSGIVHSPLKSSPDHRSLKSRKKPPGRGVMCDGGGSRRMRQ